MLLSLLGLTLFVSAFLLFCCEPMVGKMVLPILGGAASVWTTCVLFFQTMLLAGYVYTHLLGKRKSVREQIIVHVLFMLLALPFLPIGFAAVSGRPSDAPVSWLFGHLVLAAGIPFMVISATAPLLQNWLTRTPAAHGRDPYFLYSLSNAGSLLALIAYPLIFEPRFGVHAQSRLWLDGYGVLLTLVGVSAALIWRQASAKPIDHVNASVSDDGPAPAWKTRLQWLLASFVPSALMLAVTNHNALNVGSLPFLWVIPLAVYLLTFIMAFARRIRLPRHVVSILATVALLAGFPLVVVNVPVYAVTIWELMTAHVVILFACALLCHTALADNRPSTKYLTEFYFIVALGGVIGGIFTAIVAPAIFKTIFEYPLLVAAVAFFRSPKSDGRKFRTSDLAWVAGYAALVIAAISILNWQKVDTTSFQISFNPEDISRDSIWVAATGSILITGILLLRKKVVAFALAFSALIIVLAIELPKNLENGTLIDIARDFFGVKKVLYDSSENARRLLHGDTLHGVEILDPEFIGVPVSYFHESSPIGDVMGLVGKREHSEIAIVGLGTGTIAGYGNSSRHMHFFDVDPQVVDIASRDFTFLRHCAANCKIDVGDGRLLLQEQPDAGYDLIIQDAFNSDSIPSHLISREAVHMYMTKLRPGGILLFHVSNRYLDVEKLATVVAFDEGLQVFVRHDGDETPTGKAASDWVVAVRSREDFNGIPNQESWEDAVRPTDIKAWTDDYSNMLSVIKW